MFVLVFIIGLVAEGEAIFLPIEIMGVTFGIVLGCLVIASLIFYQNRFHTHFTIDHKGVVLVSGRKERGINRIGTLFGIIALFSGRPGVLGANLLATSQETSGIRWHDVYKITVHPRLRAISLHDSWHVAQRLYCTPNNFDGVVERVHLYFTEAEQWRRMHPAKPLTINYRYVIIWTILSGVATVLATAWETEELTGWAIAGGSLVWISGMLRNRLHRGVATLSSLVTLCLIYLSASLALRSHSWGFGLLTSYGYEYDTEFLMIAGVGYALLLILSLLALFGHYGPSKNR
jgi:hypothetical protein